MREGRKGTQMERGFPLLRRARRCGSIRSGSIRASPCWTIFANKSRLLIKTDVVHGVVAAVARPQLQFVNGRRCRDQGVSQFHVVALGVVPQVIAGPLSD